MYDCPTDHGRFWSLLSTCLISTGRVDPTDLNLSKAAMCKPGTGKGGGWVKRWMSCLKGPRGPLRQLIHLLTHPPPFPVPGSLRSPGWSLHIAAFERFKSVGSTFPVDSQTKQKSFYFAKNFYLHFMGYHVKFSSSFLLLLVVLIFAAINTSCSSTSAILVLYSKMGANKPFLRTKHQHAMAQSHLMVALLFAQKI